MAISVSNPHTGVSARVLLLTLASLAVSARLTHAQEVFPLAQDPKARALVEQALADNPSLVAARERTLAATARIDRLAALADPVLSVGYEKGDAWLPGRGADTGPRLSVSQDFPFSGKRQLARETAGKDAELTRHATSALSLGVIYEVRKALADLLLARENIAIIRDQRQATADIEELSRARYSAGLAGQLDVLRAQAELARFDQMRLHEEGLETSAIAELNRLRARPEGTAVEFAGTLRDLVSRDIAIPNLADVLAKVHGDSPEERGAATLVERSSLQLDLARRNLKPDFVLSSSYAFRGSLPDRFMVEVGVILPAWRNNKQRQAIVEAEADLRSSRAEREAMTLRTRAALEKAYADFKAAVLEARTIEKEVLVIDELAVESALAGFRSGQTPFISVLEAHNALYRDRKEHAELLFHVLWHSALLDAFGMQRMTS
ncbi:MAG: TolC family protein [Vicinamibacteria bacterium]